MQYSHQIAGENNQKTSAYSKKNIITEQQEAMVFHGATQDYWEACLGEVAEESCALIWRIKLLYYVREETIETFQSKKYRNLCPCVPIDCSRISQRSN